MLKKTIDYVDYNGNDRSEDFYFNISHAELLELEASEEGGYGQFLENIVNENNPKKIIEIFKTLILKAYGQKSVDGRHFVKNDEIRADFEQSEAFNALVVDLVTNAGEAAEFANGILPQDLEATLSGQGNRAQRRAQERNRPQPQDRRPSKKNRPMEVVETGTVLSRDDSNESQTDGDAEYQAFLEWKRSQQ